MTLNKIFENILKEYTQKLITFVKSDDMDTLTRILNQYNYDLDKKRVAHHGHGTNYGFLVFIEYNKKIFYYVKTREDIQYLQFLLNKYNDDSETIIKVYEYDKNILFVNNYIKYGIFNKYPNYKPKKNKRLLEDNNDKETAYKVIVQIKKQDINKLIVELKNKDYIEKVLSDYNNTDEVIFFIDFINKYFTAYRTSYSIEDNRVVVNNNLDTSTLEGVYNHVFDYNEEYHKITDILNRDTLIDQPTYKPKKINRVIESNNDFVKVPILVDNIDESEIIQKKLFDIDYEWETNLKTLKNFYDHDFPIVFFAYVDDMNITFLDIINDWGYNDGEEKNIDKLKNGRYPNSYPKLFNINSINEFLNIIKYKGQTPTYKPKKIDRVLESIPQNYKYFNEITKEQTKYKYRFKTEQEFAEEYENNGIVWKTPRYLWVPGMDYLYGEDLREDIDTFTTNDSDDIIGYDRRINDSPGWTITGYMVKKNKMGVPTYKPKKVNRTLERKNNMYDANEILIYIKNDDDVEKLRNIFIDNNLSFDVGMFNICTQETPIYLFIDISIGYRFTKTTVGGFKVEVENNGFDKSDSFYGVWDKILDIDEDKNLITNILKQKKINIVPKYKPKKINRTLENNDIINEKLSDKVKKLFMLKSLQKVDYNIYCVKVDNKKEKNRLKNFLIDNNLFDIESIIEMDKHPNKVYYYLSIEGNKNSDFYFRPNTIYTDLNCDDEYFNNYFLKYTENPYPNILSVDDLIKIFNEYAENTLKPSYNKKINNRILEGFDLSNLSSHKYKNKIKKDLYNSSYGGIVIKLNSEEDKNNLCFLLEKYELFGIYYINNLKNTTTIPLYVILSLKTDDFWDSETLYFTPHDKTLKTCIDIIDKPYPDIINYEDFNNFLIKLSDVKPVYKNIKNKRTL